MADGTPSGPTGTLVGGHDGATAATGATGATTAATAEPDATMRAGASPASAAGGSELPIILPSAYTIGDELARGGMGRILKAEDRRLHRPVAIKELLARTGDLQARFEREALITASLQHPSIVPIYEAGRWPSGEPFYTMKLVSGRPLDQLIAEAETQAARIALLPNVLAMVEAVAYAHSHGIVHRDLKPHNVLVGDFGETIVIDWGLAKAIGDTRADARVPDAHAASPAGPDATVVGSVMGTPAYMPPEQARGEAVDARADVYSLGAVLYHVLARRAPYVGTDSFAVLKTVLAGPPPPLPELAAELPVELVAIVVKAMAREPAARYASAGELALDLRRFQTGQLVGVHRYSTGQLLRRWAKRNRAALTAGTLALVAVIAVAVIAISRVVDAEHVAEAERATAQTERAAAETQRDEARAQRSAADSARVEVQVAGARLAHDQDSRHRIRDREVAMDHYAHTKVTGCPTCHVADRVTLSRPPGTPGHEQCKTCHTAAGGGSFAMTQCDRCHAKQRVSAIALVQACESDASVALRAKFPVEAVGPTPAKKPPCFRHERVEHFYRDVSAKTPAPCQGCHGIVADPSRWGDASYKTLRDLRANPMAAKGNAAHDTCDGRACHASDLAAGGSPRCETCHSSDDDFKF